MEFIDDYNCGSTLSLYYVMVIRLLVIANNCYLLRTGTGKAVITNKVLICVRMKAPVWYNASP